MVDIVDNEVMTLQENKAEMATRRRTPGQILREARIASDQSEVEIATRLYLSRSMIRFIEHDEYDKLPGIAFIRGYLRAYARLVGLSPDEIMAAFDALGLAKEPMPILAPVTRTKKQVSANDKSIRWLTTLIIATLIALVFSWWHGHSDTIDDVVASASVPVVEIQSIPPVPPKEQLTQSNDHLNSLDNNSDNNKEDLSMDAVSAETAMITNQLNDASLQPFMIQQPKLVD